MYHCPHQGRPAQRALLLRGVCQLSWSLCLHHWVSACVALFAGQASRMQPCCRAARRVAGELGGRGVAATLRMQACFTECGERSSLLQPILWLLPSCLVHRVSRATGETDWEAEPDHIKHVIGAPFHTLAPLCFWTSQAMIMAPGPVPPNFQGRACSARATQPAFPLNHRFVTQKVLCPFTMRYVTQALVSLHHGVPCLHVSGRGVLPPCWQGRPTLMPVPE